MNRTLSLRSICTSTQSECTLRSEVAVRSSSSPICDRMGSSNEAGDTGATYLLDSSYRISPISRHIYQRISTLFVLTVINLAGFNRLCSNNRFKNQDSSIVQEQYLRELCKLLLLERSVCRPPCQVIARIHLVVFCLPLLDKNLVEFLGFLRPASCYLLRPRR